MEILPIIFSVIVIVLTIVLSVVGIQMVLVLLELKRTLKKFNAAIDTVESKVNSLVAPIQNLGGMASGLQTGFKVFESFVGWLHRSKEGDRV